MAAYARQNAIKEEDLINVNQDFMPKPPNNFPGNPPQPPSNPGNSGGSYPINPSMPQPPPKQAFTYPSQPAQNTNQVPQNNSSNGEFDPLPSGFLPSGFNAPTSPAPQPPNNENPNSSAPLHGQIYDDGQNLNQAPNNDNNEIYQAPSIRGPSNTQQTSGYGKSKEAEQPYNGGQSASVNPPPSYTVINDTDKDLTGYNSTGYNAFGNNKQKQSSNDDDFDIDALMPSIPTGFKGNNNDDDNQPGNSGSGGDFDDFKARFANLKITMK